MRTRHTFRLPPALANQLAEYALRKGVSQALIVETALASFLSPDGSERLEAAMGRRLDRHTRQMERLERNLMICLEAIGLFVRFWLTSTPATSEGADPAMQAKGRQRYEGFVEALGRRIAKGQSLADEVTKDRDSDIATNNSFSADS